MSRELWAVLLTAHSSMLAAKFQFSVFHFQLFLGVPAKPSGFPLYLFSPPLSLRLKKDAAAIPNAKATPA